MSPNLDLVRSIYADSQLPVEQMRSLAADVFQILDGKVVRLMHYPDRDHALADLGLKPEGEATDRSEYVRKRPDS